MPGRGLAVCFPVPSFGSQTTAAPPFRGNRAGLRRWPWRAPHLLQIAGITPQLVPPPFLGVFTEQRQRGLICVIPPGTEQLEGTVCNSLILLHVADVFLG